MNDRIYKTFCIVLFTGMFLNAYSQLYINEFQAYNASAHLEREWGNFPDWIEVFNGSEEPVNLKGYYITDDPAFPDKWKLPSETIHPGEFELIYADGVAYSVHTNFSLNGSGEQILLFTPDLVLVDSVGFSAQYPDISYGRYPDGSDNWFFFEDCTPKRSNSINRLLIPSFAESAQFFPAGGYYQGSVSISLNAPTPGAEIRYTLDGSDPTLESSIYSDPLVVSSTTVIRAKTFKNGIFSSPTVTQTYILDKAISLPVVSIATDWDYLWDGQVGIYVEGDNGITGNCSEVPVNYNQDWERPINIEYYDREGNQGFNQLAGTKIFGACSRRAEQKSLSVFARKKYGAEKFDYRLFMDKDIDDYRSFIIRNSGNDIRHTMLRDGMMQTLVKDRMDMDYQEYQPAIIFLNGAYWGILNIREKLNEDYLAVNHGVNPDSVDILYKHVEVIEGTDTHYQNMMEFLRNNDLTDQENYSYLGTQMDINQFLNYYITQIYVFNQDWPQGNIKYWRPQTTSGRWRWMLYDLDFGFDFLSYSDNMVEWVTNDSDESTELFRLLLQNPAFYNEFLQRLCTHMNTSFVPDRVIRIIDSLANQIEDEMPQHIERFNWPKSMSDWYDELQVLRDFANTRIPVLTTNLIKKFGLAGNCLLSASCNNDSYGSILISGVEIPGSFSGSYFKEIPIRLSVVPKEGYVFLGWEGASTSMDYEIELTLSDDAAITAHFGPAVPISNLLLNEVSSDKDNAIQDDHGELTDWIEVFNTGSEPIQLGGLFFTDSIGDLSAHRVPFDHPNQTIVYPDSCLVLYADNQPGQGPLHLNFKLSNNGETIALSQRIGNELIILDSMSYSGQLPGLTSARIPDGTGLVQKAMPTPGGRNMQIPHVTGLYINEFSSSNNRFQDEAGDFDDWIEIFNHNNHPVDIGGLYLTDSLAEPGKYRIPFSHPELTTIPANGYLLLWADNQPEQGILHLGFGLKRGGEQIGLVQYDGSTFIDSISYAAQYEASSHSRFPDGAQEWRYLPSTPGSENIEISIQGLYINEFSTSNSFIIADEFGEYDDWIEIYNGNDVAVDVGGLFFTDTLDQPTRFRIPTTTPDSTTIPPKGYMLFWADNQPGQGIRHLDFGLKRSGEQVGIANPGGSFIDSLSYEEQYANASISRFPDGDETWLFLPSSPGAENVYRTVSGLFITEFSASNRSMVTDQYGEYEDWIEIYNENSRAIDLGGLFITDSLSEGMKYRIPTTCSDSTTIPANGYLLLWADDQPEQGILHLGFGLSRNGEAIGLLQCNGVGFIDSLTYGPQYLNASLSRLEGNSSWLSIPSTPGYPNFNGTVSGIMINEFSASNQLLIPDNYGEYEDWIELYNDNSVAVNVGGLFLTDSFSNLAVHRIPTTAADSTTIPPKGYLLLWADSELGEGIRHLNFRLNRGGEQVGLVGYDKTSFIDSITFGEQFQNASLSRYPDGTDTWYNLPSTPNKTNQYQPVTGIFINEFSPSNRYLYKDNYGEYDDWIELYNSTENAVDVGGLFFTDNLGEATRYRIPTTAPDTTTIPPNGFKVFWADNQVEQGVLHLDFGLTREGEQIGLVQYNGFDFIDTVTYGELFINTSVSRYPDGEQTWLSMNSTPGTSNIKNEYMRLYINEFRAGDPLLNSTAQFLDGNWIELFNNNEYALDVGGLYLTDSLPDPDKFMIPVSEPQLTTIPAMGYLLLWTDKKEDIGVSHLNFILDRDGIQIGLSRKVQDRFVYIDTLVATYQHAAVSTGRVKDGVNSWTNFSAPTPGWSNSYAVTSTTDLGTEVFYIYPNPVSGGVLYFSQPRNVTLYTQMGIRLVAEMGIQQLDVSFLPAGLYILKTDLGEIIQIMIL